MSYQHIRDLEKQVDELEARRRNRMSKNKTITVAEAFALAGHPLPEGGFLVPNIHRIWQVHTHEGYTRSFDDGWEKPSAIYGDTDIDLRNLPARDAWNALPEIVREAVERQEEAPLPEPVAHDPNLPEWAQGLNWEGWTYSHHYDQRMSFLMRDVVLCIGGTGELMAFDNNKNYREAEELELCEGPIAKSKDIADAMIAAMKVSG